MKQFSDGGRSWNIDINVGSMRRVRADLGVDLSMPHEPDASHQTTLADRMLVDIELQVDVIWSLVKPQAEKHSVTMDDFLDHLKPEILRVAVDALLEEWRDFFHKLGRTISSQTIAKAQELRTELDARSIDKINLIMAAVQKASLEELDTQTDLAIANVKALSSANASASADDSASIPADSPGEN